MSYPEYNWPSLTPARHTIEVLDSPYAVEEPITAAQLRDHLRLNDDSEDLDLFITTARSLFEHFTGRAVVQTSYRQYTTKFDRPILLLRGKVLSIDAVKYYDADDDLQTVTDYKSDLTGPTGRVWLSEYPSTSSTLSPVAYIDFTAGWETCPNDVKLALLLVAGHLYENREAFTEKTLKTLPLGFQAICDKYMTGVGVY